MKQLYLAFVLLCSGVALLTSCSSRDHVQAPVHWKENAPRRAHLDLIVILTPPSIHVEQLIKAVRSELKDTFDVHVIEVRPETTWRELGAQVSAAAPRTIIALDNPTISKYGRWAREQETPPPAILAMASFVEDLLAEVPNSTGVSFEPPAVTTLVDLRRLLNRPLRKAGVIYRAGFEQHTALDRSRLATERIELVGVEVPHQPDPRSVALALRSLKNSGVDALWVSNDNVLLSDALLAKAWLPYAQRTNLAIVVGVPGLVGGPNNLGTYAAVPDIEGLGLQIADMVFELRLSKWKVSGSPIQPALSIRTYLDVTQAQRFGVDIAQQATVDILVKDETR